MADYFNVEFQVDGPMEMINTFREEEFDNFDLKDEMVRLQIDDLDLWKGENNTATFLIMGQQAWDEGEVWLRSMKTKYPTLEFSGRVQIWEDLLIT